LCGCWVGGCVVGVGGGGGGGGLGGGGGFDIMCLSWGLVVVREYSTGRVDVYDTVLVSYCAVR